MATKADIEELLKSLAPHFKGRLMSPEDRAIWVAGWVEDFADASAGDLQRAARTLRNQAEPNSPFPTPKMVRAAMVEPERPKAEPNAPWTSEIGDLEWAELGLSDKIRHRMLQAMQARQRAIDVLAATGTRDRSKMPEEGHRWLERAAWLEADAKRLKEHMTGTPHTQRAIAA